MLEYNLGEMKGTNSSALRYEVDALVYSHTLRISEIVVSSGIYKKILKKVPSERVSLYFQYVIRKTIYPFVRQASVIRWYKRNGKIVPFNERTVCVPHHGIFLEFKNLWSFEDVPIKLENRLLFNIRHNNWLKNTIKTSIKKCTKNFGFQKRNYALPMRLDLYGNIACHYNEGLDLMRRNDINWFLKSGINPERVLIYFDHNYSTSSKAKVGNLVKKEVIQWIEKQGFRWVALEKNVIENQGKHYWQPPSLPKGFTTDNDIAKNQIDEWIVNVANDLLDKVHYWRCFYDEFDIRINHISEEGMLENIAQAIAFDIDKTKPGILIGRQRSEFFSLHAMDIGFHPKHIFFIWNNRVVDYLNPNYDQNETFIISGYTHDIFLVKKAQPSYCLFQKLKAKGVNFTIALFDTVYGLHSPVSKNELREFYQTFFQWVKQDPMVGLIIKSKKSFIIDTIFFEDHLYKEVLETGRCVRIEDELGRLPLEASLHADMAVGIGISSAVIEAVIGGCKGILYDCTCFKSHEFYRWGYEQIIFDNLQRLSVALKRYKEEPNNEPKLGDWSEHLDELDPFRDGRGGERMGTYIRWVLESFDAGKNRDEAIRNANEQYAKKWGEDKIIDMESQRGKVEI